MRQESWPRSGTAANKEEVEELILKLAWENRSWGYTRIQEALANLRHEVGRGTIANVLKADGLEPAPQRRQGLTWKEFLKTHWEVLATTDFFYCGALDGEGVGSLSRAVRPPLGDAGGANCGAGARIEQFVRTIRQECLDRMIFFGEASLRRAVEEFIEHYNHERNHQSLDNKIIQSEVAEIPIAGTICCRKRQRGLLRYYYREPSFIT